MKKSLIFIIIFLLPFSLCAAETAKSHNQKIHPSFLHLLKTQPRKGAILYPLVPRVSAKQAYYLFSNNKAILFGVGDGMNGPYTILGAIKVPRHKETSPGFINKLKTIKNKYILVFCS